MVLQSANITRWQVEGEGNICVLPAEEFWCDWGLSKLGISAFCHTLSKTLETVVEEVGLSRGLVNCAIS